ncbi:alpha/beta fold hydrolase [Patescibacteria group bacterium]|nr:alpha/beta fold hydrolase [Patescibacteria group bacterium]
MEFRVKEKAKPYFYEADSDSLAILIHGFTGSPDDFRDLAKFLVNRGITVSAILLPGHGSYWKDLEKTTHYHWWKTVDDEINKARGKYKKIYLIGYSFGANLAFDMAARYPKEITSVISLGISVYLRREFLIKTLLPFFHFFLKRIKKDYIKKDQIADYEDRGCYLYIPTASTYEFYKFINTYTKKELAKVTVPSLIIHSQDDTITNPKSSQFVHQRINSPKKELLILDDINHNPLISERKDVIFSKIMEFINS